MGVDKGDRVMNGIVMVSLHPRGPYVIVPEGLEPLGIFLSGWPFCLSCIAWRWNQCFPRKKDLNNQHSFPPIVHNLI